MTMDKGNLLKLQNRFSEFLIKEKLSTHHNGEREVYLAEKDSSKPIVLTVFSLDSPRYAGNYSDDMTDPDFIEEIWFLREHQGLEGLPPLLDWGFQAYEGRRYVWITQTYVEAESLNSLIWRVKRLPLATAVAIARCIGNIVQKVALFTGGGGHYNLSPHNVLVRYDRNRTPEVFLIGFTNLNVKYSRRRPDTIYYGPHSLLPPPPIDLQSLDKRVMPLDLLKGNCNNKTDVFALGMLTMIMMVGYPTHLELRRFVRTYTDELMETENVSTQEFYHRFWFEKESTLTNIQKAVLKKATELDEEKRLDSVDEFMDLLSRFENEIAQMVVCANYKVYSSGQSNLKGKPTYRRRLKRK